MRAVLLIGTAIFLSSCNKFSDPAEVGFMDLDCHKGFEALASEIRSSPGVVSDERERGSSAYRDDRLNALFLVTRPDHPAHPAIFVRRVLPGIELTITASGGCGFGDRAAFEREMQLYAAFDRLLNAEEHCYLCSPGRPESPTVDRRLPPPPM